MGAEAFKCPRGYDPCRQIGCNCRADSLKKRFIETPGSAKKLLDALMEPIDEDFDEIESMTDEEVSAYLVAEGFDLDDLQRKFQKRMFDIQAKLLAEDLRLLFDNRAVQSDSFEMRQAVDKIKQSVLTIARLCPNELAGSLPEVRNSQSQSVGNEQPATTNKEKGNGA